MRRVGPGVVLYSDNEWGFGVEAQKGCLAKSQPRLLVPDHGGQLLSRVVDSLQAVATNGAGVQSMEILSFVYSWNMAFYNFT
jgi:hypothetical protein